MSRTGRQNRKYRQALGWVIMGIAVLALASGRAWGADSLAVVSPKEQRQQDKELRKEQRRKERLLMKQDLTQDQQKQLAERVKALEGMAVGQRVLVERGVRGAPTDTVFPADSLGVDSLLTDSLLRDSLGHVVDTAFLGRGEDISQETDSAFSKPEAVWHFRITQDTIKAGRLTWLAAVAPGFGQIYNRQAWKVPILYGTVGGFLTGGFIYSHQYKKYDTQYKAAVAAKLPPDQLRAIEAKRRSAGSGRTLMFGAAAASYLYFLSDAVFHYRGPTDPVRKATTLAAVFPGMGFVYTKTYWRLPIYYGGFIALATVIDYNNRSYQRYKRAYDLLTDGDPTTQDEFKGRYPPETIARVRSSYRRDRDFAIICTAAAYLLSVVDTYVISTLKNWDMDQDLTAFRVAPTMIQTQPSPGIPGQVYGLGVQVRF